MARDIASRIAALVHRALGIDMPVGLRAFDGSRAGPADGPCVVLQSRRALRRLLWNPDELGLARGYIAGEIDVDGDLAEALRRARAAVTVPPKLDLATRAGIAVDAIRLGVLGFRPPPPVPEARPAGRLHSPRRDRDVIAYHYDLGNDFYRLLLDESMAYSCALWTSDGGTSDGGTSDGGTSDDAGYGIGDAQRDKLDLVCRKLGLHQGMRLLDVGCGWGSLVLHAAKEYGVQATGVTLSGAQAEFVRRRAAEAGLGDQVWVRCQDYREDVGGPYDAVASIEMGEHVGDEQYPTYAGVLREAVRPGGGLLLLQQMSHGPDAPGGGPFIESFIAPDMTMRPLGATVTYLERAGFEIRDVQAMREHYARTATAWAATLDERWDDAVALIGVARARVWRLYLVGGALAFADNRMGVDQILARRPDGA
jgi:cyclopropane-fatty-acyl-phospholipid synthase